jgi:hypothetical protein
MKLTALGFLITMLSAVWLGFCTWMEVAEKGRP